MAGAAVAAALIFASAVSAHAECRLNSPGGAIKHVVYLEFDNVHFTRDNPSVPSDLEQMPNLLNFLKGKGTLDAGDHAVLISHTANDILTTQQLHDYDVAFGKFFARLKGDGIDESNTLFLFTPDEGDHYAGAGPTNPGCDGVTTPCIYAPNTIGELDIGLKGLVAAGGGITSFSIHSDSAPTIM
jgi:hypothetical protein